VERPSDGFSIATVVDGELRLLSVDAQGHASGDTDTSRRAHACHR
jgi:hypothetical protein